MKLDKQHGFDAQEALDRLRALTDYWSRKYGVRTDWTDSRASVAGKVKGIKFEGEFTVGETSISGDLRAGFLAEKLGGRQYVEGKIDEYLDPGTPLATLQSRG